MLTQTDPFIEGKLRLLNVRTGKLVHEFGKSYDSAISVLEQSSAVDIIAVGLQSGHIILHNIKYDEVLKTFKQDAPITSVSFRQACLFYIMLYLLFRKSACFFITFLLRKVKRCVICTEFHCKFNTFNDFAAENIKGCESVYAFFVIVCFTFIINFEPCCFGNAQSYQCSRWLLLFAMKTKLLKVKKIVLHVFSASNHFVFPFLDCRTDGEEIMSTSSSTGAIAVWDLNKGMLIGEISNAHRGLISRIHFLAGESLMVSAGADNTLKTWVYDMGDGMPRQLVLLEGHSKPLTAVKFISSDM